MSYCVNCGIEYVKPLGICPNCNSDQRIPNELIDAQLLKNKGKTPNPHDLNFGYPGEKGALVLSVIISIIIGVILGAVSFGLFLGILILNLGYLKLHHISSQKNMLHVSDNSFKDIFNITKIAAFRLKLPMPEVYIVQDPQYNAYTAGFYKFGFVVLNSSLVSDFKPAQLLYVIGHELGHMKRYHTTWLQLLNPTKVGGAKFIFAPIMRIIFNVWSVKAEYTADQAGLIACQDLNTAVGTLLKLAGGIDPDTEIDLTQYSQDKKDKGEASDIVSGITEYFGTHPFNENRIKQLIDFWSRIEMIHTNR